MAGRGRDPRRMDDNAWLKCEPASYMSGSSGWQDLPEEVVAILQQRLGIWVPMRPLGCAG